MITAMNRRRAKRIGLGLLFSVFVLLLLFALRPVRCLVINRRLEQRGFDTKIGSVIGNRFDFIISPYPITDADLRWLHGIDSITNLSLRGGAVQGGGFVFFTDSRVDEISLVDLELLEGKYLYNLVPLRLKELTIRHCPVGDEGLRHICSMTELELLTLDDTKITWLSEYSLDKLRRLQRVCPGKGADDRFAEAVAKLPMIEYVSFDDSQLTDRGLEYLVDCPSLRTLDCSYSRVTIEGKQAFRELRPDVYLDDRPRFHNLREDSASEEQSRLSTN